LLPATGGRRAQRREGGQRGGQQHGVAGEHRDGEDQGQAGVLLAGQAGQHVAGDQPGAPGQVEARLAAAQGLALHALRQPAHGRRPEEGQGQAVQAAEQEGQGQRGQQHQQEQEGRHAVQGHQQRALGAQPVEEAPQQQAAQRVHQDAVAGEPADQAGAGALPLPQEEHETQVEHPLGEGHQEGARIHHGRAAKAG
jgi:hypothetical protein